MKKAHHVLKFIPVELGMWHEGKYRITSTLDYKPTFFFELKALSMFM